MGNVATLKNPFGLIWTNAFGKNIRELSNHSSTAGENCKLTIDIDLQQYISGLFEGLVGTVVVSDNTNGNILSLFSNAYFFTADSFNFLPLPAGLSGAVITPTTLNFAFISASKVATANSGVPIKIIRRSLIK